jgi:hypothetical protein
MPPLSTAETDLRATYAALDLGGLPFDVTRHAEALDAFARLGLPASSVRPALRARDLVFRRIPSGPFRISLAEAGAPAPADGCTHFEIIYEAATPEEARAVRGDVERYFQRHFPGRTLAGEVSEGCRVTVTCYPAPD